MLQLKCEHCDKSFATNYQLNHHTNITHKGLRFQCELCPKNFSDSRSLKHHIKAIHENSGFKCIECDKQYLSKSGLKAHFEAVTKLDMPNTWENVAKEYANTLRTLINKRVTPKRYR